MDDYIYADCAASAPVLPCALEAFERAVKDGGNPSSVHSLGRKARDRLEEARAVIANCIHVAPEEIYFTSGATESCNIIANTLKNHSVHPVFDVELHSAAYLYPQAQIDDFGEDAMPFTWEYETGRFAPLGCNETGIVDIPVKRTDLLALDATASMGHFYADPDYYDADYLAAGAHKFGGLPGIGFLYVKKGRPVSPVIFGGGQENGVRGGTQSVALACAMAAALRYRENTFQITNHLSNRRTVFERDLVDRIDGAKVFGYGHRLPGITAVTIPGISAAELVTAMDALGVCISAGSACNSQSQEPSRVLLSYGLTPEEALSTVRISLDEEHVDCYPQILEALCTAVEKLRR